MSRFVTRSRARELVGQVLWYLGTRVLAQLDRGANAALGLKEKAVGWGPVGAAEKNWTHTSGPAESRQSDRSTSSTSTHLVTPRIRYGLIEGVINHSLRF